MKSTDMVSAQHYRGRWGAKRAEEEEKLEAKKLFSLYNENLKAFSMVEDKTMKFADIGTERGPKYGPGY